MTTHIAERLIAMLNDILPQAEIYHMGATALQIAGLNDIDIYIFCPSGKFRQSIGQLSRILGHPTKRGHKWQWREDGYAVAVNLINPKNKIRQEKTRVYELIRNNHRLLKQYEMLKIAMNGQSYQAYLRAKFEFYNRILRDHEQSH
ncbi:GrpB family protein [Candidatus Microgenomates bacterium]|nr:GrpB family protein [Candidatus Microgenomates bacterium]